MSNYVEQGYEGIFEKLSKSEKVLINYYLKKIRLHGLSIGSAHGFLPAADHLPPAELKGYRETHL